MPSLLIVIGLLIIANIGLVVWMISRAPETKDEDDEAILAEDLDDYERDYYERKSEKSLQDFVFSMRAFFIGAVIFLLCFWLFACGSKTYALIPDGVPMRQEEDRVLGVFQSVHGSPDRYHAQWFYFPGHAVVDPHTYRIRVVLEKINP